MKKGFTLIELLVVVLIIGVLSAVALPQYQKAVNKARVTEAWNYCKTYSDAQKIYHLANGTYTGDLSRLDIEMPELKNFIVGTTFMAGSSLSLAGTKSLAEVSFTCYSNGINCYDSTNTKKCIPLMPCSSPMVMGGCSATCSY